MQIYESGAIIADRYEIVKMAGAGGMGVVYYAVDHGQNGLPVALKTFHRELLKDRTARDQFLKEATVWLELGSHPHIVEAYNVQHIEGRGEVFIAAELIGPETGKKEASLRAWIEPGGMEWKQALLFGLQIVWGMQHAVSEHPGLVHRDLKPDNVLVGGDKLGGTKINRLRVTDFGLIGGLEGQSESLTVDAINEIGLVAQRSQAMGGVVGTPAYMSQEQWLGEKLDARADIYAWGLIMAELLSGRRMVRGSIKTMREMHMSGVHLGLSANKFPAFARLIEQSTAREVESRPANWDVLEEHLYAVWQESIDESLPLTNRSEKAESVDERNKLMIAYNSIGSSYDDISKYDVALRYYVNSLRLTQEMKDREFEGVVLGNMGLVYYDIGEYDRALGCHEQSLTIARELGDRTMEGAALGNMGLVYHSTGEYEKALGCHEQLLALARKLEDRAKEGTALGNIGIVYQSMSQYEKALGCHDQYLMIAREVGDRVGEGLALRNMGDVFDRTGQYEKALGCHKQYLAIARELGDRAGEGAALDNTGTAYYRIGQYEKALDYYEQGLTIARELGNRPGEGTALGNIGNVYDVVGQYEKALDCHEQYLAIVRELGDRSGEGRALGNLGLVYQHIGQYERALGFHEQLLEIARKLGDRAGEGRALGSMGNAYQSMGQYEMALDCYTKNLAIVGELGDVSRYAIGSLNLGILLLKLNQLDGALICAREAQDMFERIGQLQHAQQAQNLTKQIEQAIRQQKI